MSTSTLSFLSGDFLLETPAARTLYHEIAVTLPVIDYHNHLPPREIAEDRQFENLTQIWLAGDHYKWRAMRTNGIAEQFITGNTPDREKFMAWAATVPATLRNPLYHWTHMELKNPFGIYALLNPETAADIWDEANRKLATPCYSVRGLLERANVEILCTTDDPTDDLAWHETHARDPACSVVMLPAFRPDAALGIEQLETWNAWVDKLGVVSGKIIHDWSDLLNALDQRCAFFHGHGCRLSDHGLEQAYGDDCPPEVAAAIFARARRHEQVTPSETQLFRSALLHELGLMYARLGWTQQFHLGALRNVNTGMLQRLGRDCGCDVIGDFEQARPLAAMLARWEEKGQLAKTILYNLNPRDSHTFACMCGAFQGGGLRGKIQYGSAWWFLDQLHGMEEQIEALSNLGLLSCFVGMLTDSRSFLSFSRHEYFRRLLCNMIGRDIARGMIPDDLDLAAQLVRNICHDNAARYFEFEKPNH